MADRNEALDLVQYHQAVIDTLAGVFPVFKEVTDYPQDRKQRTVPALYIDLEEMEEANKEDAGTGQVSLCLRMSARIVLPASTPQVGRTVRALAAAVAATVHQNRFGVPINAAQLVGAYPDHFEPELDQFVVWRVDWQHVAQFGVSVWLDDNVGTAPANVFSAFSENGENAPLSAFEQIAP